MPGWQSHSIRMQVEVTETNEGRLGGQQAQDASASGQCSDSGDGVVVHSRVHELVQAPAAADDSECGVACSDKITGRVDDRLQQRAKVLLGRRDIDGKCLGPFQSEQPSLHRSRADGDMDVRSVQFVGNGLCSLPSWDLHCSGSAMRLIDGHLTAHFQGDKRCSQAQLIRRRGYRGVHSVDARDCRPAQCVTGLDQAHC